MTEISGNSSISVCRIEVLSPSSRTAGHRTFGMDGTEGVMNGLLEITPVGCHEHIASMFLAEHGIYPSALRVPLLQRRSGSTTAIGSLTGSRVNEATAAVGGLEEELAIAPICLAPLLSHSELRLSSIHPVVLIHLVGRGQGVSLRLAFLNIRV